MFFVENQLFYALRHPQEPLFHKNTTQPGVVGIFSRGVVTFSGGFGAGIFWNC